MYGRPSPAGRARRLKPASSSSSSPLPSRDDIGESGFRVRLPAAEKALPDYDAATDANVPILRRGHFRRATQRVRYGKDTDRRLRLQRLQRRRAVEREFGGKRLQESQRAFERGEFNPAPAPASVTDTETAEGDSSVAPAEASLRSASTPHGGVTWQRAEASDPDAELEVLKAVMLRESYLERLRSCVQRGAAEGRRVPPGTMDLLDLLRVATVEAVEAIVRWCNAQPRRASYLWNGINYLLRVPTDVEGVDAWPQLRRALGFSGARNPFLIDKTVDQLAQEGDSGGGTSADRSESVPGTFQDVADTPPSGAEASLRSERQLPAARARESSLARALGPSVRPGLGQEQGVPGEGGVPHPAPHTMDRADIREGGDLPTGFVGDLDMARVIAASRAIVAEEAVHGRMVRDAKSDRVVPAQRLRAEAARADAARAAAAHREEEAARAERRRVLEAQRRAMRRATETRRALLVPVSRSPSQSGRRASTGRAGERARPVPHSDSGTALLASTRGSEGPMSVTGWSESPHTTDHPEQSPPRQEPRNVQGQWISPVNRGEQNDQQRLAATDQGPWTSPASRGEQEDHQRLATTDQGPCTSPASRGEQEDHQRQAATDQGPWASPSERVSSAYALQSPTEDAVHEISPTARADPPSPTYPHAKTREGRVRGLKSGGVLRPRSQRGTDGPLQTPSEGRSSRQMTLLDARLRAEWTEAEALNDELSKMEAELDKEEQELAEWANEASAEESGERGESPTSASLRARRSHLESRSTELRKRTERIARVEAQREAAREEEAAEEAARRQELLDQKRQVAGFAQAEGSGGSAVPSAAAAASDAAVEDAAAVSLQRIARGRIGRRIAREKRIQLEAAALTAQRIVRGFVARRRMGRVRRERQAAVALQRVSRGFLARAEATQRKRLRKRAVAAKAIQALVRGSRGRKRALQRKRVARSTARAVASAEALFVSDLRVLVGDPESPPPALHKLLTAALLLCHHQHSAPLLSDLPWGTVRQRIATRAFLARARAVAGACAALSLALPLPCVRAAKVIANDPTVGEEGIRRAVAELDVRARGKARSWNDAQRAVAAAMARVRGDEEEEERQGYKSAGGDTAWPSATLAVSNSDRERTLRTAAGSFDADRALRSALAVLSWVRGVITVDDNITPFWDGPVDPPLSVADCVASGEGDYDREPSPFAALDTARASSHGVLPAVLFARPYRTRPMLVIAGFDVPSAARTQCLGGLESALPGSFTRVAEWRVEDMQAAFDAGQSVIAGCDTGLSVGTRDAFLARLHATVHALRPPPQTIVIVGDADNSAPAEGDGGAESQRGIAPWQQAKMGDWQAKQAMQRLVLARKEMTHKTLRRGLQQLLARKHPPCAAAVSVAESIVIIAQATRPAAERVSVGPGEGVAAVAWQGARRALFALVGDSPLWRDVACIRPASVDAATASLLRRYSEHPSWRQDAPSVRGGEVQRGVAEGPDGRRRGGNGHSDGAGRLSAGEEAALQSCRRWVTLLATASAALHRGGGAAPPLSRAASPAVDGVVVVGDSPGPPQSPTWVAAEGEAWRLALARLLAHALADVCVLRTVAPVRGTVGDRPIRMVITVHRDARRVFLCAYHPASGAQRVTWVGEEEAAALAAVRAHHSKEDSVEDGPPQSPDALHRRLASRLLLSRRDCAAGSRLVVAAPRTQLYKHAHRCGGRVLTLQVEALPRAAESLQRAVAPVFASPAAATAAAAAAATAAGGDADRDRDPVLAVQAYDPAHSVRYTLRVSVGDARAIARDALRHGSDEEVAAFAQAALEGVAAHVACRVDFSRGALRLRRSDGGGSVIARAVWRLSGRRCPVALSLLPPSRLRLRMHDPPSGATFEVDLGRRARRLLLGKASTAEPHAVGAALRRRLRLAVPAATAAADDRQRTPHWLRVLQLHPSVAPGCPDPGSRSPVLRLSRRMLVRGIRVGGSLCLVEVSLLGAEGGVEIGVTDPTSGRRWRLACTDQCVQRIVGGRAQWPPREHQEPAPALRALVDSLRWVGLREAALTALEFASTALHRPPSEVASAVAGLPGSVREAPAGDAYLILASPRPEDPVRDATLLARAEATRNGGDCVSPPPPLPDPPRADSVQWRGVDGAADAISNEEGEEEEAGTGVCLFARADGDLPPPKSPYAIVVRDPAASDAGSAPQPAPASGSAPQPAPASGSAPQPAPASGSAPQPAPLSGIAPQPAPASGSAPHSPLVPLVVAPALEEGGSASAPVSDRSGQAMAATAAAAKQSWGDGIGQTEGDDRRILSSPAATTDRSLVFPERSPSADDTALAVFHTPLGGGSSIPALQHESQERPFAEGDLFASLSALSEPTMHAATGAAENTQRSGTITNSVTDTLDENEDENVWHPGDRLYRAAQTVSGVYLVITITAAADAPDDPLSLIVQAYSPATSAHATLRLSPGHVSVIAASMGSACLHSRHRDDAVSVASFVAQNRLWAGMLDVAAVEDAAVAAAGGTVGDDALDKAVDFARAEVQRRLDGVPPRAVGSVAVPDARTPTFRVDLLPIDGGLSAEAVRLWTSGPPCEGDPELLVAPMRERIVGDQSITPVHAVGADDAAALAAEGVVVAGSAEGSRGGSTEGSGGALRGVKLVTAGARLAGSLSLISVFWRAGPQQGSGPPPPHLPTTPLRDVWLAFPRADWTARAYASESAAVLPQATWSVRDVRTALQEEGLGDSGTLSLGDVARALARSLTASRTSRGVHVSVDAPAAVRRLMAAVGDQRSATPQRMDEGAGAAKDEGEGEGEGEEDEEEAVYGVVWRGGVRSEEGDAVVTATAVGPATHAALRRAGTPCDVDFTVFWPASGRGRRVRAEGSRVFGGDSAITSALKMCAAAQLEASVHDGPAKPFAQRLAACAVLDGVERAVATYVAASSDFGQVGEGVAQLCRSARTAAAMATAAAKRRLLERGLGV